MMVIPQFAFCIRIGDDSANKNVNKNVIETSVSMPLSLEKACNDFQKALKLSVRISPLPDHQLLKVGA